MNRMVYINRVKSALFCSLFVIVAWPLQAQNMTMLSGGSLINNGTIVLNGNFLNQSTTESALGTGTFDFSGTAAQTIAGPNAFGKLKINNASGVTIVSGIQKVSTQLILTNGHLTLGDNNLTLGSSATVSGTPSPTAMVIATGNGELRKEFPTGFSGSFVFPVGDATVQADYSPVTLNFTAGSFAAGNFAGVVVKPTQYPGDPNTGSHLNRYWTISSQGITGFNCDASFNYVPGDVSGTENQIQCVRMLPTPCVSYNPTNTVLHQLTANTGSFGSFAGTIALAQEKVVQIKFFIEGLYNSSTGFMNQTQNCLDGSATFNNFSGIIVDTVSVLLADASNPNLVIYQAHGLPFTKDGLVSFTIPASFSSSYYLILNYKNAIETWSSDGVLFNESNIQYDFTQAASSAYGDNLLLIPNTSVYAIYSGDFTSSTENKDGYVDGFDYGTVFTLAQDYQYGYLSSDLTGDGFVDGFDNAVVFSNSSNYIGVMSPIAKK